MSYSVFSTMTVAGAVAEATLVAQNRDRAAAKAAKAHNMSVLDKLRNWTTNRVAPAARREQRC
ncbi:MAG: hypothetical protein AAF686_07665 [Pseudomonadota bacterium]